MVTYEFKCGHCDYEFEGVFGSHDEYQRQKEAGLVECPSCRSTTLDKLISKVNIGKSTTKNRGGHVLNLNEYKYVGRNLVGEVKRFFSDHQYAQELVSEGKKGFCGAATHEEVRELREEGLPIHTFVPRHLDS